MDIGHSSGAAGTFSDELRALLWFMRVKDGFSGLILVCVILVFWFFGFLGFPTYPTDYYKYSASHFIPLLLLHMCKDNYLTIMKLANYIALIQLLYLFSGIIMSDIQCYLNDSPSSCSGKYVVDLMVLPIAFLMKKQVDICSRYYVFGEMKEQ